MGVASGVPVGEGVLVTVISVEAAVFVAVSGGGAEVIVAIGEGAVVDRGSPAPLGTAHAASMYPTANPAIMPAMLLRMSAVGSNILTPYLAQRRSDNLGTVSSFGIALPLAPQNPVPRPPRRRRDMLP